MATTITGGYGYTGTITSPLYLSDISEDPVLITTGAEGALGTIVGSTYGIAGSDSYNWTITNQGTVRATAGAGIVLNAGGSIANQYSYARIEGTTIGVTIAGTGTVGNEGTIVGTANTGVVLGGAGSVLANGSDYATQALVSGGVFGARLSGANAVVTNGGTIIGGFYDAVLANDGGTITNGSTVNASAFLDGNNNGAFFKTGVGIVLNYGTIRGSSGSGLVLVHGGTVTNKAGATISGRYAGVEASLVATVTNDGSITASQFYGILLRSGGRVTNGAANAQALISGAAIGVRSVSTATVVNAGTISSQGTGILLEDGKIINGGSGNSSATIVAADLYVADPIVYAVRIHGQASVQNWGTIAAYSALGTTMRFEQGGVLENLGTASQIVGGAFGVVALDKSTMTNEGLIASRNAVDFGAGGALLNTGTIRSTAGYAVHASGGPLRITNLGVIESLSGVAGVKLERSGVLRNGSRTQHDARIQGDSGATLAGNKNTVINEGTITGQNNNGLALWGGGTVVNGHGRNSPALIVGNNYGIHVPDGSRHTATISNAGVIYGGLAGIIMSGGTITNSGTILGQTGVHATGTRATTIINTGYINGFVGDAVDFADADGNVFAMSSTARVGAVHGGALTDTLVLMGTSPARGLVWDIGTRFTDFDNLAVTGGAYWQLVSDNELPNGADISLDGTLEVSGTLTVSSNLSVLDPSGGSPAVLQIGPRGIVEVGTGSNGRPGRLTVDSDGRLNAAGFISGRNGADTTVVNDGTIEVLADATLAIAGRVVGAGTFALGSNASLILDDITRIKNFLFPAAGGNEAITMPGNTSLTPIIRGFADADAIDIKGFAADPALTSFIGHILTMEETGGRSLSLQIAGPGYSLASFQLTDDGAGGTLITHV